MRSWFIKIFVMLICVYSVRVNAQNTFSRFIDFEGGTNDRPYSLLLEQDGFVLSAGYSGDTSFVSSLARYDYDGNELLFKLYIDFVIGVSESIIMADEGYRITGNNWSHDKNDARGNRLLRINSDFEILKDTILFYQEFRTTNTFGVRKNGSEHLIYFEELDLIGFGGAKGHILLMDSNIDTVKQRIEIQGEIGNRYIDYDIQNLQPTPDGNLTFMANSTRSSEVKMFELTKINREGEILKRITVPRRTFNSTLVQDELGDIYFYTRDTPFLIDSTMSFPNPGGGINKLNADLDSVIWSRPFNRFEDPFDPRQKLHRQRGTLPLRDGSFLAYGEVEDIIIFKTLGFLTKFDSDGEILWTRFFQPTLPDGTVRESVFRDCKELPDGRILCAGESVNPDLGPVLGDEIWLLMLDEEGCLEPGCGEEVIITSTSSTLPTQEGRIYPNPVSDILQIADVSFDRYEIVDIVGRQVQVGGFSTEVVLSSRMSKGMYILQLIEDGQLKSVFKFLKE